MAAEKSHCRSGTELITNNGAMQAQTDIMYVSEKGIERGSDGESTHMAVAQRRVLVTCPSCRFFGSGRARAQPNLVEKKVRRVSQRRRNTHFGRWCNGITVEDTIVAARTKKMSVAVVRSAKRRTAQCIAQSYITHVSERGITQGLEKDSIHKAMRAKMQCCFHWCCLVEKYWRELEAWVVNGGAGHLVCGQRVGEVSISPGRRTTRRLSCGTCERHVG